MEEDKQKDHRQIERREEEEQEGWRCSGMNSFTCVRSLDDVTASTGSTSRYCTAEKGNFTNLPDKTRVSEQVRRNVKKKKKKTVTCHVTVTFVFI